MELKINQIGIVESASDTLLREKNKEIEELEKELSKLKVHNLKLYEQELAITEARDLIESLCSPDEDENKRKEAWLENNK